MRCLFGKDNENFLPVRAYFRLNNWFHNRRPKLLERLEATANLVIGKDMILYGRKRGLPASTPSANGASAMSGAPVREG